MSKIGDRELQYESSRHHVVMPLTTNKLILALFAKYRNVIRSVAGWQGLQEIFSSRDRAGNELSYRPTFSKIIYYPKMAVVHFAKQRYNPRSRLL